MNQNCIIETALCRRMTPDHAGYEQHSMSRGGLHARLRTQLRALGLDEGESMHSFRRGVAMQLRAQGANVPTISRALLIQTEKVVTSCYLPAGRHDTGVKRQRRGSSLVRPDSVGL